MRYAIVIEKAGTNYSAHVPELPGCVAMGRPSKRSSARSATQRVSMSLACRRMDWRYLTTGLANDQSPPARPNILYPDLTPAHRTGTRP
jgi:hypothetical protein